MAPTSPDVSSPIVGEREAISYLRSSEAIRSRCGFLFQEGVSGKLDHFSINLDKLPACSELVRQEILAAYPSLDVPFHSRWRHFDVGGVRRVTELDSLMNSRASQERARAKFELAIVSVLLDAGAGSQWRYRDARTGEMFNRSEGLAVASLDAFIDGSFGSPCSVTGEGLLRVSTSTINDAFQVSDNNPLVGVEGRTLLLNQLGRVITQRHDVFPNGRLGDLVSHIAQVGVGAAIAGGDLLRVVLDVLSPIWPGRIVLAGENLGDVWRHSKVKTGDATDGLVPFHKLSQWLTYSLLEPLAEAGVSVEHLDQLTGLAEYRNGGLFIDSGVLELKDPSAATRAHVPSSELIVEWRALTVALLDLVAEQLRKAMNLSAEELPLVKVLQGGTWSVGRRLAAEKRANGAPPLTLNSDGTVF